MSVLACGTTKVLKLEGQKVKIKKLSYGEQKEAMKLSKEDEMGMMDEVISKSVIEWDIKDEKGDKLLISKENLNRLEAGFINLLAMEIMGFNNLAPEPEKNLEGPSKQD